MTNDAEHQMLLEELLRYRSGIKATDSEMQEIITELIATVDEDLRRKLIARLTCTVRQQLSHMLADQRTDKA